MFAVGSSPEAAWTPAAGPPTNRRRCRRTEAHAGREVLQERQRGRRCSTDRHEPTTALALPPAHTQPERSTGAAGPRGGELGDGG